MASKIKFSLRPFCMEDLEDLVANANNKKVANNLTDMFPNPYRKADGIKFIKMAMEHEPNQIFTIDIEGKACGGIGLHPQSDIQRKNAELGYWLAEQYWGNGIITEAIKQIVVYGFQTFDIERIYARPFGDNKASQRALQKAGFVLEAHFKNTLIKNGVYQDELYFAVRRNDL